MSSYAAAEDRNRVKRKRPGPRVCSRSAEFGAVTPSCDLGVLEFSQLRNALLHHAAVGFNLLRGITASAECIANLFWR